MKTIDFSCKHDILIRNKDGSLQPMDEPFFQATKVADGVFAVLSDGDLSYLVEGGDEAVIRAIRDRYDAALAEGKSPLILALDGHLPAYGDRRTLSLGADAADMAHMIFARLRDADDLGADTLFSEAVSTDGLGLAVMNRLGRAAAFHIEHVSEEA